MIRGVKAADKDVCIGYGDPFVIIREMARRREKASLSVAATAGRGGREVLLGRRQLAGEGGGRVV